MYSFNMTLKLMPAHMEKPYNLNKVEEDSTGSWNLKRMRDKCVTVQCPWQGAREKKKATNKLKVTLKHRL